MPGARLQKPPRLRLRLYIAGNAPNSLNAVANARAICEEYFPTAHELEIVDLLIHPQRAAIDGIVVTPTLLKLSPPPAQRMVGNLGDARQVVRMLAGT